MYSMLHRVWRHVALGLLSMSSAHAQEAHQQHTEHQQGVTRLTLGHAIALGAKHGPDGTRANASKVAAQGVSNAAPYVAHLPFVRAQVGPRWSNGDTTPEVVLSVEQPFTWNDSAGIQARVAKATRRAAASNSSSAELLDAERAAHAWLDLALANQVLELRRASVAQTEALLKLAEARVTAGEGSPVETALAASDLAEARSLVLDAEGLHFTAELGLAYALGLAPGSHIDTGDALSTPPPLPQRAGGPHPDVLAADSRRDLALQHVELAKLQQSPMLALGVQYQREGTGDQILTAVATIPLPIARPWAFQQAEQRLAAESMRAEAQYVRAQNAAELEHARHERAHTQSQYDHLKGAALPPLREAHRLALARYTNGATDLMEVTMIRQRLLRAEEQLTKALAEVNHAHVRALAVSGQLTAADLP